MHGNYREDEDVHHSGPARDSVPVVLLKVKTVQYQPNGVGRIGWSLRAGVRRGATTELTGGWEVRHCHITDNNEA